jgi:glyoxylase I family protein
MDAKILSSHLKRLEKSLLSKSVRKNPSKLSELIADEFREIGKSGRVWTKQTVIDALKKESYTGITITDFNLSLLSENIALVTYTAHHEQKRNVPFSRSIRSSIWKMTDNKWKMVFHQGTPVTD